MCGLGRGLKEVGLDGARTGFFEALVQVFKKIPCLEEAGACGWGLGQA